jgi:hypothetical protein
VELQPEDAEDLPDPPPVELKALVDTGARRSCIEASAARSFGVYPNKQCKLRGLGTSWAWHDVYEFHLAILNESGHTIWEKEKQELVAVDEMVCARYNLIVGRDILGLGTFVYYGRRDEIRLQFRPPLGTA